MREWYLVGGFQPYFRDALQEVKERNYLDFVVFGFVVLGIALLMVFSSYLLGPKAPSALILTNVVCPFTINSHNQPFIRVITFGDYSFCSLT